MATDPRRARLKAALTAWFQFLRNERNLTTNTLQSYKDTWRLLVRFGVEERGLPDSGDWRISQIDRQFVLDFLSHLERRRRCAVSTRNQRLAALQSFFSYLKGVEAQYRGISEPILAVPRKRTHRPVVGYLESDELKAVFNAVNVTAAMGLRDLALLAFAYNTGARVHEIAALCKTGLQLRSNPCVRLWGKGRKQRELPLYPSTVKLLDAYLTSDRRCPRTDADAPYVFLSLRGERMTRFGVAEVLERAFARAAKSCPTLQGKHLTAHCMRHTTAVHLLNGGASHATIQNWLGHDSANSVQIYLSLNLKNKRDILERCLNTDYVVARLSEPTEEDETPESAEDWLRDL